MKLNKDTISEKEFWRQAGVRLPDYSPQTAAEKTVTHPTWLHFGAGNIFRGFIARISQELLEKGLCSQGVIAAETFDYDIIDKIYKPCDNLAIFVGLKPDGTTEREIVASITDGIRADFEDEKELEKLKHIFTAPSLQLVSFTITEKGYALEDMKGALLPAAKSDIENGSAKARHAMGKTAALLLERYRAGERPVAMVSMDNCSHNGEKLKNSVLKIAGEWERRGYAEKGFLQYLQDETKVSFPWSMIDKITPRPAEEVEKMLEKSGIEQMQPVITGKNTYIAPFVNAEIPQYLVIEDRFPNGRPPLEQAGVYLTDRDTVNKTEKMKVTTCLNPLHTALAVYGCLLGYRRIAAEMKDGELKSLIEKIGYEEGMPVVVNPGILDPMEFIYEVIDVRLPNPFIPDMPQRIATDTSQKVPIRFGETIKSYMAAPDLDPGTLTYIPLAIAGWLRYLLGIDDEGKEMEVSPDPMLPKLQSLLDGIEIGNPDSVKEQLKPILSNPALFAVNLYEAGLGEKIEKIFRELIAGSGAVRHTLKKYLER